MKILIHYPFTPEQIDAFRELAQRCGGHTVLFAEDEAAAVANAGDVEVLLGRFPASVCAAAEDLRWIQSFSTGMDKFLFPEIIERDEVMISNVAGLYASQGAEHAWALLLALTRGITTSWDNQKQKKWGGGSNIELAGSTLGLVGLGGFGTEMAKRAQGYRMTILAVDPVRTEKPDYVSELTPTNRENLHRLLERSDVVMMACPLTAETYHLISTDELAAMKSTAYLINVTRGGIIDEPALVEALKNGQIAGAGLDVVEKEPLAADSPLWEAPNLILTPHRAGASQHRPRMIFEFFMQNLERYLTGERPLAVIDKRKGY
ncbi:MAG: D-2-hydroxyacid dehydrogenase [Caldilineaceae bacterium]|nr:D-2-hydroxyacid dehydrogenase [Caldilineaceae bacterium]